MLRPLFVSFGALALLTGLAYPVALTGLARLAFPHQAGGSLVVVDGQVRGSRFIGQATEDPRSFWGRPSATALFPTNPNASGGSCLATSNPALAQAIAARVQRLKASDPGQTEPIPIDLVTASASGLDPHISPEAARWQAPRVARMRGLPYPEVLACVEHHVLRPPLSPAHVNVLALNLALERLDKR